MRWGHANLLCIVPILSDEMNMMVDIHVRAQVDEMNYKIYKGFFFEITGKRYLNDILC